MSRVWHTAYLVAIAILIALIVDGGRQANPERFQAALIAHTRDYADVRWLGVPV